MDFLRIDMCEFLFIMCIGMFYAKGKDFLMKDVYFEQNFLKDVLESLMRLRSGLLKRAKIRFISRKNFETVMRYLDFLQKVASDAAVYCKPGNFVNSVQRLGFDVDTDFTLFDISNRGAQSVYDIMVCVHDYVYYGNEEMRKNKKLGSYKYKSQQEVVEAMRLFKRDSIQMNGGVIPYFVRNLFNKNR